MNPKAKSAAVALFIVAGLLLISILTYRWFTNDDSGIGMIGVKFCDRDSCESQFWLSAHRAPGSLILLALLGLGAGFTAIGTMIHSALMLTRGTPASLKTGRTTVALGTLLFATVVFAIVIASERRGHLDFGWGFGLCITMTIIGLIVNKTMVAPVFDGAIASNRTMMPAVAAMAPSTGHPIPAFPLVMQDRTNRMHGHVFLAPGRLYFICLKTGGAWLHAISVGVGGLVGGALAQLAMPTVDGVPQIFDEAMLQQAVAMNPGSFVMEARNIEKIQQNWAWRFVQANGKKYGLPNGLGGNLKAALGPWARYHQVPTVGFA